MVSSSDILKANILIVDDQDANTILLEEMLRGVGYESITCTSDPHKVCELHRQNRYSLILLDLLMPGLDGFGVMEGLKAIETEGYLPVLVQTAQPNHKLRALKAGAKDFISKPFNLAEVLIRVHNLLEVRLLHQQAALKTEQAELRMDQSRLRTDQVELESKVISASELSYRRLFEAAQDGILMLDVDTGCIKDVNPFLTELLGFSHEEIVGKTVGELIPFRNIEPNRIMLQRLQKDSYVCYEDLALQTRAGRQIVVKFVSNLYQVGDSAVIQCNIRDITEGKLAEDKISLLNTELEQRVTERTAQLRAANDELEAFSYSISHDLRAPLRHVLGYVSLLEQDAGPSLSEKSAQLLATISLSAHKMAEMIDDLLTFSHMGKIKMQKKDVNLGKLVREVVEGMHTKEQNIVWDIHPLPIVQADRALLRMVFVNLVSNALKFSGKKEQAKIEIGCLLDNIGETVIFLRDNGAGFDPDFSDKLFGVFQRLHTQEEFEGMGIGLANVQRIIKRHGGRVWAKGVVDGGATFFFSIPKENSSDNGRWN